MTERRYRRDIGSLQLMFAFVSEFLAARGLSSSNAFPLELILEELFTNVLKSSISPCFLASALIAVAWVRTYSMYVSNMPGLDR